MPKFPEKETPGVASNAGVHEVPCTHEAGVCKHLDEVNRSFAAKEVAAEEARIEEAFQLSHDHLVHDEEVLAQRTHVGPAHYELDPNDGFNQARREGIHEAEEIDPKDVTRRYRSDVPNGEK
jgi:hypothetical protein